MSRLVWEWSIILFTERTSVADRQRFFWNFYYLHLWDHRCCRGISRLILCPLADKSSFCRKNGYCSLSPQYKCESRGTGWPDLQSSSQSDSWMPCYFSTTLLSLTRENRILQRVAIPYWWVSFRVGGNEFDRVINVVPDSASKFCNHVLGRNKLQRA